MKKNTTKMKKTEEFGLNIKIEVDGCPGPTVCVNMYGKVNYTIYKEHNWN